MTHSATLDSANLNETFRSQIRPRGRRLLALLSTMALLGLSIPAIAAPPGPGPQVGTNLGFLDYSSGEWPFVDVFKTSSRWFVNGSCGVDCAPDLDDNGWIETLGDGDYASTYIFTDVPGQMPHQATDSSYDYHVIYDGIGVLDYDGVTAVDRSVDGHHIVTIDPASTQPFLLTIVRTTRTFNPEVVPDPNEYVRNIRVIAPGGVCSDDPFESCHNGTCGTGTCNLFWENDYVTQRFHPDFLANVRQFDVIRMLDWMDTVETEEGDYARYPTESSARWRRAPAAVMADLANRLDADLWINIPHVADTDFAAGLAGDLVPVLEPARKVYLEFANETWNSEFPVYAVATTEGCSDYDSDLDCSDPDDAMTARARYTVDGSIEAWDAFATEFDALPTPSSATRLVRVLASQIGNSDFHGAMLSHRGVHASTDALAVGGYFGWSLGGNGQIQNWDPNNSDHMDDFFELLDDDLDDTIADMTWDRTWLASSPYSSVPLVLYEGGQGLVAYGPNAINSTALEHANRFFEAANEEDDMRVLYEKLLENWQSANGGGGVLFNHYVNCRAPRPWGNYGALSHQRQVHSTSPRYTALMNFIGTLP